MGKKITFAELIKLSEEKETYWKFSNDILYDLCKKNPFHKEKEKIIAKIWLIGRSYAASIERGVEKTTAFIYEDSIVPIVLNHSNEIDSAIKNVAESLEDVNVFNTFGVILKCFNEISKMWNISLTSKYLHFHCSDAFYMYDSRAAKAIGVLTNFLGLTNRVSNDEIKDFVIVKNKDMQERMGIYVRFYLKCKRCVNEIEKKFNKKMSPRDFDNLLLTIADREISISDILMG